MGEAIAERLRGAWRAWTNFWFRPADPTPLCLMRIVAGLLTLYVHVSYSFDLQAFFGPKGWYERPMALRALREFPNLVLPKDWEGLSMNFRFPPYVEMRKAVREFVTNLAERPAAGEKVLNLLGAIAAAPEDRMAVMAFMQYLPSGQAGEEKLQRMVDGKVDEGERLPEFFLRQPKPGRENLREDILRFRASLPADKAVTDHIYTVLTNYNDRDIAALRRLVLGADAAGVSSPSDRVASGSGKPWTGLANMTPDERRRYLDYVEHWGVGPEMAYVQGHNYYSPFFHTQTAGATAAVHGLHLLVIVLFTAGFQTRLTSVLAWLAGLAYYQRNPLVLFGQDTMMNLCLFYLMLAPCGAVWSVDAWLARRRGTYRGPVPSVSANFATRALQVQYCLMYLSAGLSKLKGQSWWSGTAPWYTMTNPEFSPLYIQPYVDFLSWLCQTENRWLWETYMSSIVVFTLVLEIGFPVLVWTRLRPIFIAGAILLHLGIAVYMGLIVFSLFMMVLQLCWMTPTAVKRVFGEP